MFRNHLGYPITKITRENIEQLLDNEQLYVAMAGGRWWRARRNGKTRRSQRRIYLPIKLGFRFCSAIDESDFINGALRPEHYRHINDVPNQEQRS